MSLVDFISVGFLTKVCYLVFGESSCFKKQQKKWDHQQKASTQGLEIQGIPLHMEKPRLCGRAGEEACLRVLSGEVISQTQTWLLTDLPDRTSVL